MPRFASHLEHAWQLPKLAHFYNRLASFSRLIIVDKRGVGLSVRVPPGDFPGIEQRTDDLAAVVDSAGIERTAMVAVSDGGPSPCSTRRPIQNALSSTPMGVG